MTFDEFSGNLISFCGKQISIWEHETELRAVGDPIPFIDEIYGVEPLSESLLMVFLHHELKIYDLNSKTELNSIKHHSMASAY